MSMRTFDKRMHFIRLTINAGYDCTLANDWYIGEKDRNKTPNDELLKRFTEWMGIEDPTPASA